MLTVQVIGGAGQSASGDSLLIGRGEDCDLRLEDDSVSYHHLRIRPEGAGYVAEDLESTNGTYLGGAEVGISRAMVRPGDTIRVGSTYLLVRVEAEDGEPEPTATASEPETIRLTVLEPEQERSVFVSRADRIVIGRRHSSDVVVEDPTVSRCHAVITRTRAGFVINDQDSANAVRLGEPAVRVSSAILGDGDVISLGESRLRVNISGALGDQAATALPTELEPLALAAERRPDPELLRAHLQWMPLFRSFEPSEWDGFVRGYEKDDGIHTRHYAGGDVVCEAGRFEVSMVLVIAGRVDAILGAGAERREVASYREGDFYGMLEAKRALPRPVTLVARTRTTLLYIPRHQVRLLERNAGTRALLDLRSTEEGWRVMAAKLPLLAGVPAKHLAELMDRSEILRFDKAGVTVVSQEDPGEAVYVVRSGYTQISVKSGDAPPRIASYLGPGDMFGEAGLLEDRPYEQSLVTAGAAELFRIKCTDFRALCERAPEVAEKARAEIALRSRSEEQIPSELSRQLEDWGQGYIQADALLVMDLELCVKCDLCVDACADLHGESRLVRRGMQLGKYLVPSACRHCDDPKCMFSCPTGAIDRRPEGEIYVRYDMCVGCGACATACPYDNISMIETNKFDAAQARKESAIPGGNFFRPFPVPDHESSERGLLARVKQALTGQKPGKKKATEATDESAEEAAHAPPPSYPIKCDLCDGLPFMGCVHACPTGAAQRVDPTTVAPRALKKTQGKRERKMGSKAHTVFE